MKALTLALVLAISSFSVLANSKEKVEVSKGYPTKIQTIKRNREYRIYFKNGDRYYLEARNCYKGTTLFGMKKGGPMRQPECVALNSIKDAIRLKKTVSFKYYWDQEEYRNTMTFAEITDFDVPLKGKNVQAESGYKATNLESFEEAKRLFDEMRKSKSNTQCFWRATAWAYDMYKSDRIYSERIYIYFTSRYQYRPNALYDWGFHVAPVVTVKGVPFVMDPEFMDGPTPVQDWMDYFMCAERDYQNKNKYTGQYACKRAYDSCQKIDSFKVYEENQYSRYCYYQMTNMYHWYPGHINGKIVNGVKEITGDVERADVTGKARMSWNYSEVETSLEKGLKPVKED